MNKLNKNLKRLKQCLADLETLQAQIQANQEMLKSADAADLDVAGEAAELDTMAQIVAEHIAKTQDDLSQAQSEYNRIYPGLVLKRRVKQNFYAALLYTTICTGTLVKSFSDSEHVTAYKTAAVLSALFIIYHSQQTRNYYAKLRDFANNQKYQR